MSAIDGREGRVILHENAQVDPVCHDVLGARVRSRHGLAGDLNTRTPTTYNPSDSHTDFYCLARSYRAFHSVSPDRSPANTIDGLVRVDRAFASP